MKEATAMDRAVLTLKRRHLKAEWRRYQSPGYQCGRCPFSTAQMTEALWHALDVHGDRTSPVVRPA